MTNDDIRRKIEAAIVSIDQIVFVYLKDNGEEETRYATPISVEVRAGANVSSGQVPLSDLMVLCSQHLPADGYRKFAMSQMKDVTRVISRTS